MLTKPGHLQIQTFAQRVSVAKVEKMMADPQRARRYCLLLLRGMQTRWFDYPQEISEEERLLQLAGTRYELYEYSENAGEYRNAQPRTP